MPEDFLFSPIPFRKEALEAQTPLVMKRERRGPMTGNLKPPIFVMGCGHSGTTLVRELVGAHSRILKTPDEMKLFRLPEDEREPVIEAWDRECLANGSERWLNKMAAYVYDIETILARFPDAQLLFVLRDGRDVALSIRKRWDFERGVARWIQDNRVAQPFLNVPNIRIVRYEEVVHSTRETLKAVFGFLGLPYEDEVLEFWRSNREQMPISEEEGRLRNESADQSDFRPLRKWQISQPIYDATSRWRVQLSDEEKAYFKREANDLLIEFGYATDQEW